jgi:hypothetical protein
METFMVRLWTPDGDGWSPGMRGTATHIASGKQVTFTEAAALIAFLSRAAPSSRERAGDDAQPPDGEYQSHTSLT